MEMGFSRDQAEAALDDTRHDLPEAISLRLLGGSSSGGGGGGGGGGRRRRTAVPAVEPAPAAAAPTRRRRSSARRSRGGRARTGAWAAPLSTAAICLPKSARLWRWALPATRRRPPSPRATATSRCALAVLVGGRRPATGDGASAAPRAPAPPSARPRVRHRRHRANAASGAADAAPSPPEVAELVGMGFDEASVREALRHTGSSAAEACCNSSRYDHPTGLVPSQKRPRPRRTPSRPQRARRRRRLCMWRRLDAIAPPPPVPAVSPVAPGAATSNALSCPGHSLAASRRAL